MADFLSYQDQTQHPHDSKNPLLFLADFDETLVKRSMHKHFAELKKGDMGAPGIGVSETEIDDFILKDGSLTQGELILVIRKALEMEIVVKIATFTHYPKAVEYVIHNHFGLSSEHASKISVIGGFPADYHQFDSGISLRKQKHMVGKNFHIVEGMAQFLQEKGRLPEKVLLIDNNQVNIDRCAHFLRELSLGAVSGFKKYLATKLKLSKN